MNNPLIYWLLFSVAEAIRHLVYIKTKKKSPRKWLSLIIRTIVYTGFMLYELKFGTRPAYIVIPAYICSATFIHDTLLAVGTGIIFNEPRWPWYVNKKGYFDKPQNNYSPYIWIFKLLAGVTIPLMYFLNYPT